MSQKPSCSLPSVKTQGISSGQSSFELHGAGVPVDTRVSSTSHMPSWSIPLGKIHAIPSPQSESAVQGAGVVKSIMSLGRIPGHPNSKTLMSPRANAVVAHFMIISFWKVSECGSVSESFTGFVFKQFTEQPDYPRCRSHRKRSALSEDPSARIPARLLDIAGFFGMTSATHNFVGPDESMVGFHEGKRSVYTMTR